MLKSSWITWINHNCILLKFLDYVYPLPQGPFNPNPGLRWGLNAASLRQHQLDRCSAPAGICPPFHGSGLKIRMLPRFVFCVSLNGYGSIPINTILMGWTSIYQLFWCSPGVQGFDTLPNVVFVFPCCFRNSLFLPLKSSYAPEKKETRPSHVACSQKRTFLDLPCKWRKPKICCYNAAQDCPNTGGTLRWLCTRASPTHWETAFTVLEVGYIRILQCSNRFSFISIHQRI